MKKVIIERSYSLYDTLDELSKTDQQLLQLAKKSLNHSYSPYSNFKVGAGLLLENGEMVGGSNQENASYPLCLCAERVAIAAADSQYNGVPIVAIAVTAKSANVPIKEPISPCGACRQVLCETEQKHKHEMRVILQGETGQIMVFETAKDLLPFLFDGSFL